MQILIQSKLLITPQSVFSDNNSDYLRVREKQIQICFGLVYKRILLKHEVNKQKY